LSPPEKVQFKYKLEGFDKDWINADTRRVALPTPTSRQAGTASALWPATTMAVWNETGAAFGFYLAPHFYQRIWFYTLGLGVLLFTLGAGSRLRLPADAGARV
jgi:hypothetical protein